MFTGVVEEVGTVVEARDEGDVRIARIAGGEVPRSLTAGASVAVNGCCLTAASCGGEAFTCALTQETLSRTSFGEGLAPGALVNLERPMRADGRFDGHIVQGHIDGVGRILALRRTGAAAELVVECPPPLERYIVEKGSIAVDGISLTVVSLQAGAFSVAVIPYTLERTNLRVARAGDRVNLEVDVVAKYVEKLLPAAFSPRP